MSIVRVQFHHHERGLGDEDWHYLARDTDTGDVFVVHEWCHRGSEESRNGSERIKIGVFLTDRVQGTKQSKLLALIGSLVAGETDA